MSESTRANDDRDWRPRPDPTELTTKSLQREIEALKELIIQRVDGDFNLQCEKFSGIQTQFKERDARAATEAQNSKDAIAAALQAQKEAVGKTETTFADQIKQLNVLISTTRDATQRDINEVKARLDRGEGHTKGMGDGWGYVVAAVGVLGALVGMFFAFSKH